MDSSKRQRYIRMLFIMGLYATIIIAIVGTIVMVSLSLSSSSRENTLTIRVVVETVSGEDHKVEPTVPQQTEPKVEEIPDVLTMYYTEEEMNHLGRLITKEAGALSDEEMRAVGMNVLHRVDHDNWPDDIISVVEQTGQYATDLPTNPSERALEAAFEVLDQWNIAKNGLIPEEDFQLPEKFLYFFGDGKHNYFYCYENGVVVFYDALPNAPLPSNINELYEEIVLKKSKKARTTTPAETDQTTVVAEDDGATTLEMEAQNPDEGSAEVGESMHITSEGSEVGHCL